MKPLLLILGALMAIFGMTMTCTPVATFLETGYFFAILLLVFGVISSIDRITEKKFDLNLAFALLTAVFGILLLAIPGFMAFADGFLIYIMAVWFILQGAVNIYTAVQGKKHRAKGWFWGILLGIVDAGIGIYSLIHPMILAFTLGILVGCYFIISGVQVIISGLKYKKD